LPARRITRERPDSGPDAADATFDFSISDGTPLITRANPLAQTPPTATPSSMAVGGHPIHPMLVNFPIAYLFGSLPADFAFFLTGDPFWARLAFWLIVAGLAMGALAALFGTLDFLFVKEVRRHTSSWTHFLMGVTLLAIAAANMWMRLPDAEQAVLPWGLFLSGVTAVAIGATGWMGGKLVFDHNVGRSD
jgi:uncharacterized membrane protein